MYVVGRLGSYISRGVYSVAGPFHPFGGAVDIIIVEQPDGSYKSSPWYVRFGKFQGVLKTREKVVNITINEVDVDFHMYLDHKGEAYFLREAGGTEEEELFFDPSSSGDEKDSQSDRKPMKSQSLNFDVTKPDLVHQIDEANGKNLTRTSSRRSMILEFFGRRSMKEQSSHEGDIGSGIGRASSLECAEIAADLLDMKWSTGNAATEPGKDTPQTLDCKADKDLQVNDEQTEVKMFVHNIMENMSDDSTLQKETCTPSKQKHDTPHTCSENCECSVNDTNVEMSCIATVEQVEACTNNGSLLENNCYAIHEISEKADELPDHDEHVKGVIFEISDTNSQLKCTSELEEYPGKQFEEHVFVDEPVVYWNSSECIEAKLDDSDKFTREILFLADGGDRQVHVHAEILRADLSSKVLEVLPQEKGTEQVAEDIDLKAEMTKVSGIQSHQTYPSDLHVHERKEMDLEKSLDLPESCGQVIDVDPLLNSVEEAGFESICTSFCSSTLSNDVQDEKSIELQFSMQSLFDSPNPYGDGVLANPLSVPPSRSSEKEQFVFTDLNELKLGKIQIMKPDSQGHFDKVNDPSYVLTRTEGVDNVANSSHESCSPSSKFVQESPLTDSENSTEKSRLISSPINIPIHHNLVTGKGLLKGESLPNMPPHMDYININDLHHPLSSSLCRTSKSLNSPVLGKDDSNSAKSKADNEAELTHNQHTTKDRLISGELKSALSDSAIELSLCKHLLYEGMGVDAASQAFEAEKLDIDKFTSLLPEVLKNDRLAVRIKKCYFPWDAAEPIILGLVSCDNAPIFEPKGIISVDRAVKNPQSDSSKANDSSSGGWWPFSFRRSRSTDDTLSTLDYVKISSVENDLESNISTDLTRNVIKPKVMKKMFRAMTPTPKQLASLNLREGRNDVTFTFFTAMLGKQQVDAKIYVWKWNTRIVISDVDGTITKSDVLGQFMPLVGKDWSQTGVAPLFSAIKENGYQLLFLSARAIAQAYITRQFLLNLKQDGKALPDGPVVISPDGLFPSLYREVIRRAPHEFKITCLEDIKALFPSDCNPFYAGFGNRDTDEISYLKVGIPKGKIFTINPRGEIAVNRSVDTKSYTSLHALVHGMFPPTTSSTSSEQEDYNSWNYWKLPPLGGL